MSPPHEAIASKYLVQPGAVSSCGHVLPRTTPTDPAAKSMLLTCFFADEKKVRPSKGKTSNILIHKLFGDNTAQKQHQKIYHPSSTWTASIQTVYSICKHHVVTVVSWHHVYGNGKLFHIFVIAPRFSVVYWKRAMKKRVTNQVFIDLNMTALIQLS